MEYMHGVLMHGDEDTGDDHKNEDTYVRLQAIDVEKAKQAQEGVGPCKGKQKMLLHLLINYYILKEVMDYMSTRKCNFH